MTRRRREFSTAVKREIWARAEGCCENPECRRPLRDGERKVYDHVNPDALEMDRTGPATAEEGQLLCGWCDDAKTPKDRQRITKAYRQHNAMIGAKKRKSRGFMGWRKFDGTAVYADRR